MLKLNSLLPKNKKIMEDLNTSHVKVKLNQKIFLNKKKVHLNTSHVKVKRSIVFI